ncbi:MAG TPA: hypothetical protein VNE62_07540 [Actinomycetota bacterium]|nr:hypothetical protein [Actinomycetota bacterium]
MQVGRRARVVALERPSPGDRSPYLESEGLLVRRLNVAWEPKLGALWELRFESGDHVVFSESELRELDEQGQPLPSEIPDLEESWGDAPRTVSYPFRRFGGRSRAAPAVLAFIALSLAGSLLVWAGLASNSLAMGAAGGLLIVLGMGAAALLVS